MAKRAGGRLDSVRFGSLERAAGRGVDDGGDTGKGMGKKAGVLRGG
jgi:hypothetical protein